MYVLVSRLQVQFAADHSKLVVLELFQGLFDVRIKHDTRSIDHTRPKEPIMTRQTTKRYEFAYLPTIRRSHHHLQYIRIEPGTKEKVDDLRS